MSNEDLRQFQFACIFSVSMNGGMALVCRFVQVPVEWYLLCAGIALMSAMVGLCSVMLRGYMPKDKADWDNFAVYCHKHSKEKGDI